MNTIMKIVADPNVSILVIGSLSECFFIPKNTAIDVYAIYIHISLYASGDPWIKSSQIRVLKIEFTIQDVFKYCVHWESQMVDHSHINLTWLGKVLFFISWPCKR